MYLCHRCKAQVGRPGHLPPHPRLAWIGKICTAAAHSAFVYRCEDCGHAILLAAPDAHAHDKWILGDDAPSP